LSIVDCELMNIGAMRYIKGGRKEGDGRGKGRGKELERGKGWGKEGKGQGLAPQTAGLDPPL